jgi:hypothetical protein
MSLFRLLAVVWNLLLWSPILILACDIRKPSFIRIWNLSGLCGSHYVWCGVIIMYPRNTTRPCIQLIFPRRFRLIWRSQTYNLSGVGKAMGSKGCLSRLSHLLIGWDEFLRIFSAVGSNGVIGRITHLWFSFISVCSCYFFQALYLACHIVTYKLFIQIWVLTLIHLNFLKCL